MKFLQPNSKNSKRGTVSPESVDFAAAMTADVFGDHYIASVDREFRDHEPTWQRLGDITNKIVQRAAALRVLDDDRNEAA